MRSLFVALPLLALAPRAQDPRVSAFDARVEALIARLGTDAREACDELARLGPRAVPRIAALLSGPDALADQYFRVRNAAYTLGRMRGAAVAAVPALLAVAAETDGELEHEVLWAVSEIVPWADAATRALVVERAFDRALVSRPNGFIAAVAGTRAKFGAQVPLEVWASYAGLQLVAPHVVVAVARTVAQGLAAEPEAFGRALVPLLQQVADVRDRDTAFALICGRALEPAALDLADAIAVALPAAEEVARRAHALALFHWDGERVAHAVRLLSGSPLEEGTALAVCWRATHCDPVVAALCCGALARGGQHAVLGLPALRRLQQHADPAVVRAAADAVQAVCAAVPGARETWESFAACTYDGADPAVHADVLRRRTPLWVSLAQGAFAIGDYAERPLRADLLCHLDFARADAFAAALDLLAFGTPEFCDALLAHLARDDTAVVQGERAADRLLAAVALSGNAMTTRRVVERMLLPDGASAAALAAACTHDYLPLRICGYARLAAQPRKDLDDDVLATLRFDLGQPDRTWIIAGREYRWRRGHAEAFQLLAAVTCIRHETGDRALADSVVTSWLQAHPDVGAALEGMVPYSTAWIERVVAQTLARLE